MLTICEIAIHSSLREDRLRERAASTHHLQSRQFLGLLDNEEAGYLSFEYRSQIAIAVVYDILVLPGFRRRGVGSALLMHAEHLATNLACNCIRLTPKAFDRTVDQEWLKNWN